MSSQSSLRQIIVIAAEIKQVLWKWMKVLSTHCTLYALNLGNDYVFNGSLQFDPAPRRGEPHVTRRTPDCNQFFFDLDFL